MSDSSDAEAQPLKNMATEASGTNVTAAKPKPNGSPSNAKIAGVVAFYWVISLTLVFLNKMVMQSNFPYPAFVTWVQLVCQLVLVVLLGIGEDKFKLNTGIPYPEFNITTARQVMPLSIIYVGLITLTNYCLRNVEISFYQLVKSLTIVSTAASIVAWVSRCSHTTHTHSLSLSLSLVR
eukprot:TRINITY_DN1683_c1_g1_i2.p1 TRINITY_DN1683_c1_g1~~TRINITY_DN1683_c1_g1_i2.p1  ORF type:complete len:179 (-),score=49.93 TRINITY_DN1683_c1_g1_i2:83-619(-)